MKAVKGYTKHDYTMICKEEGGEVFRKISGNPR